MPESRPLSICIPNYNMGAWLHRSINSALPHVESGIAELIVVDNSSTDGSWEVIEGYTNLANVRGLRFDQHVGMYENWNRAVRASSGEWCLVLCADDELLPDFGENLRPWMARHDVAAISQAAFVVELDGTLIKLHGDTEQRDYCGHEGAAQVLLARNPFPPSGTVFRRRSFEDVGGFRVDSTHPSGYYFGDYHLWISILVNESGLVVSVGKPGVRVFFDTGTTPGLVEKGLNHVLEGAVFRAFRHELRNQPAYIAAARAFTREVLIRGIDASLAGQRERARRYLLAALRCGYGAGKRFRAAVELGFLAAPGHERISRWRLERKPGRRIRNMLP